MRDVLDALDAWQAEGVGAGRAVVIRTFGSAPRPEGAVLLVAPAIADDKPANPTIDRAQLREALVKQRKLHLQRFHTYRLKKVYPHNTYEPGMKNVWLDVEGHLADRRQLLEAVEHG